MRTTFIAALVAMWLGGAASAAERPADGAAPEEPAGLQAWLAEQCPDSMTLAVTNTRTGAQLGSDPCVVVRERVLADPEMHEQLVRAYATGAATTGEQIGEARQPLLASLLCGALVTALGVVTARGECPADDPDCGYGVGGGFFAGGLLCSFLP